MEKSSSQILFQRSSRPFALMTPFFQRVRVLSVLLACLSVGLHWNALQIVGWASMAIEFSQSHPLNEALEMTFDGKHPCPLCLLVEKHSSNSKKEAEDRTDSKTKVKLLTPEIWKAFSLPLTNFAKTKMPREIPLGEFRPRQQPPVPPPRET